MHRLSFIFILFFLTGCGLFKSAHPVVQGETKQGEPVTMAVIEETASRKDIPADVAPRDVVAKVETRSGAKVWVVDKKPLNPFNKPVVYKNAQARAEGIEIAQPKDPWYKWPLVVLGLIGVLAVLYFLAYIRTILRAVGFWFKK